MTTPRITKAKFEQYVTVQRSGICNMLDYQTIRQMTSLTSDEHREIIKNYDRYYGKFRAPKGTQTKGDIT